MGQGLEVVEDEELEEEEEDAKNTLFAVVSASLRRQIFLLS